MRHTLAFLVVVGYATASYADDAADLLQKVLAAQIKDPEASKKLQAYICIGKGTRQTEGKPLDVQMVRQGVWPGQFRTTYVFVSGETKLEATTCVRDDRGWGSQQGSVTDFNPAQVTEIRGVAYGFWVGMLVPLREPGVQISIIPGVKVDGEPTLGLRVSRKAWPEMSLYFDEKTLLLRKQVYRGTDEGLSTNIEHTYRDYKEFDGVQLPTKLRTVVGTREAFNFDKLEYTFPKSMAKEAFDRPRP